MPVSKWLVDKNKLTVNERNRFFWFGLHAQNRNELKLEMRTRFPQHDRTLAWLMNDVMTAAKAIYDPLEFDNEPLPFTRNMQRQLAKDFNAEDELLDDRSRLVNAAAIEMMRTNPQHTIMTQSTMPVNQPVAQVPQQSVPVYQPQTVTKTVSFVPKPNKSDDTALTELVGRMSQLTVNDADYAVAYAQLWNLDSEFAKNVMPMPKPRIGGFYVNNQGQTVRANPQFVHQPGSGFYNQARPPRLCFFCNKPAPECLGIRSCKEVQEYANAGKILYNGSAVMFTNGNRVNTHPNGMKAAVDEFLQWQASQMATSSVSQFFFATQAQTAVPQVFTNIAESYQREEVVDPDFEAVRKSMSENAPFVGVYGTQLQSKQDANRLNKRAAPASQENILRGQQTQNTLTSQPIQPPMEAENKVSIESVLQKFMTGSIRLDNNELLAVSPTLRERLKEYLGATRWQ